MKVRMVCLAASSHNGGRCVAGKTVDGGRWIRLVTEAGPVSESQLVLPNGEKAKVGDVLEVAIRDDKPRTGPKTSHQVENRLLADSRWRKIGRVRYRDLWSLADRPAALWRNGRSSGCGQNNGVPSPVNEAGSLLLVRALDIGIAWERNPFTGKSHPHAKFRLNGENYAIRVTDRRISCPWGRGDCSFPECLVCVSLTGEFKNLHSKLAAAIIEPERLP